MNRLGRRQCATTLKARRQRLPLKTKMKGSHVNMQSRLCLGADTQESQKHVLQECPIITRKDLNTEYENILKNMDNKQAKYITG